MMMTVSSSLSIIILCLRLQKRRNLPKSSYSNNLERTLLLHYALLHFALKKLLHFALKSCYISR